ncbi:MAG: 3-isopropylmalate dehydratase small subunit [Anaerolineales bacterium]|nr:3-isopropylmalate dehydratase small subunit [Anaerolineales bacterium]
MKPFTTLTSQTVLLPLNDIDTDQIIPARFLKTIGKDGLGKALFADWRYASDGTPLPNFVLNQPDSQGAKILVVLSNFGCGSSREHAPWALIDWGFEAVLALSFADIFRSNAMKNGLLPVELDPGFLSQINSVLEADLNSQITVDLLEQTVTIRGGATSAFSIDPFARKCLLEGIDQLAYLLSLDEEITAYEVAHDRT